MADENNTNWYDGLNIEDENIGVIQTKGWQDANSIIKSYRELEKFAGKDKNDYIEIPKGEDADYSAVYARLGRPEKAEDYELQDTDFAKAAKEVLFKEGITKKQAKALEKWIDEYNATQVKAIEEKQAADADARSKASVEALKKAWGADFDKNLAISKNTAKDLNITDEELNAVESVLGAERFGKMLLGLSKPTDSNQPLTGYKSGGQETKEMAKLRIEELKSDAEFMKKVAAGDEKSVQELLRLAAITAQGN
jgi:hypothetical protein